MNTAEITKIVAAALAGQSEQYLQEVADHGIHNLTNDYHGNDDEEYAAFSAEFEAQANAALTTIENARRAEFRAE